MSTSTENVNKRDGRRDWLTPVEVECLIAGASQGPHAIRDRAMCILMYEHGFRVSELCRLKMEHLQLDAEPQAFIEMKRLKRSKRRAHPLKSYELTALSKWTAIRPRVGYTEVFLSRLNRPFTRQGINALVAKWADKAAIPIHVFPHMLRHSVGYALVNHPTGTQNLRQIQEWLGHTDIRHTERYTELSPDRFNGLWGDDA